VALLIRHYQLFRNVALDHFMREVPSHRVAAQCVDFKALLQR